MLTRGLLVVLAAGLVLVVAGLTLLLYFNLYFDTWLTVDASAPPWVDAPHDPRETVLYQSEDLVARAEAGLAAGRRLLVPGVALTLVGGLGLWLVRTRSARRDGTTG